MGWKADNKKNASRGRPLIAGTIHTAPPPQLAPGRYKAQ